MNIDLLLDKMWKMYTSYTPSANQISKLFNEEVTNDHIAFRTFNTEHLSINRQAKFLEQYGYYHGGDYDFKVKKLKAIHLENDDENRPKIFLSELLCEEFSNELQNVVVEISEKTKDISPEELLLGGRKWNIDLETYNTLAKESEYASWLYIWGFCPNHFTISVNHLENFSSLIEVNNLLKKNNFKLNISGGEIKGSKEELLEQSSILADEMPVFFGNSKQILPSCYYEFAKRYPGKDGKIYQGFVAKSADKIFESTNKKN